MDQKRRHNKFRTIRVSTEPPVALDLSRDITRLFDMNFRRKQRISEYMCESIRRTKQRVHKKSGMELGLVKKRANTDDLREYAKRSPSTLMSRFQERDINKKINARGLEDKYPQLLKTIMEETKENYLKITHYAGMNMKVKPSDCEECFIIKPFKYLGKTENYQNYLAVKQQLSLKWILHKPIIQKLLMECVTNLPYEVLNLNFDTALEFDLFKITLQEKVQLGTQKIHDFYMRIVNLIEQYNVREYNYLGACTGLLSVHLSRSMAHTLLHIIQFTTNKDMRPYLILNVSFQRKLVVSPTYEDVIDVYKKLFEDICNIISGLKAFENIEKQLHLCLTEEFLRSSMSAIETNIKKEFNPIQDYLQGLDQQFLIIYPDISSVDLVNSLTDMTLDFGASKMSYYKSYIDKMQYIPNKEYFPGGQLNLATYRDALHQGLSKITTTIFSKLSSQHYWDSLDICESFQLINMRALKKTDTTEELIETGKFMAWVKDEQLNTLTERVHESISMLSKIILLGLLTKEHMKINSMSVNWLDKIPPVIEQHLASYEQLKFEAEEKLQKMIEDVNAAIDEVFPSLVVLDDMDNINNVRSYLSGIIVYMTKIKNIEQQISWINQEEVALSFPKSTYGEYENLKNYVYPFYHLLKICLDIQRNLAVWQDGQFDRLEYESTNCLVDRYYKELIDIQKDYRKKLRQAQDENLQIRFRGTVDDPDVLNWPAPLKLCFKVIQMIEEFKPSIRLMKIMCNRTLKTRHWQAMSELAGFDMTPNAGTTLRKMMTYDLRVSLDQYEIISNGAMKENLLLRSLEALHEEWRSVFFTVGLLNGVKVLCKLGEILDVVDDHLIKVMGMRSSVFVKPYEVQVLEFYGNLGKISGVVEMWQDLQTQWLKLAPIFSIPSISSFLPLEFQVFRKIDETFLFYLGKIEENGLVIDIVCHSEITVKIGENLKNLDVVNKGVTRYLESIREKFPRLYFLADEDLVNLLSKSEVQDFLWKIFNGVNKFHIIDGRLLGMLSKQKELVSFRNVIDIAKSKGNIEKWLLESEREMRETLRSMLIECRKYCKKDSFRELFNKWSQQILELHTQILFTEAIENALNANNKIRLRLYLKKLETNIKEKIDTVNKSDLSSLERNKIKNLIITDINNKGIVKNLLEENVTDVDDFNWEIQLKYYQRSENCFVRTFKSTINYLFEYQGNSNQIIITPLTDRCFRSLINSNCLHLNALIQGSAETGKTETVKSLAKAFATLIITFNCSKCLNYETVQRLLKGAAICGVWLCIKKINLLKNEILSIIYQDISTITSSIKSFTGTINIEGNSLKLNSSCFVTMTVDRNKSMRNFPENFKLLFRCVTVSKPDLKMISEVGLYSLGFLHAPKLSKKINTCFKILRDYLFNRKSQNFGLEYIKLILKVCEEFKIKYPQQNEDVIVEHSLKQIFSPRLSSDDDSTLNNILSDLFPNNTALMCDNSTLNEAISKAYAELNLIPNDLLSSKLTETCEYIKRKHGIIILGNTSSGKTTILKSCSKILAAEYAVINPNTLQYHQLFGTFDPISNKWTDGILTKILRDIRELNNTKWIVFDGNIDPTWIENINNVLKNDKIYYLSSGESIKLHERQSIVFEVNDLKTASPTTISRCGLIYINPSTTTWQHIIHSWTNNCTIPQLKNYLDYISELLVWFITPSLDFLAHCSQLCYPGFLNQVQTTVMLFEMFLREVLSQEEDTKNILSWIQASLVLSGIWGLAGILDHPCRVKFDEFYKTLWRGLNQEYPHPKCLEKLDITIPQEGIIFDFNYIYKQRGNWKLWADILKTVQIRESEYMINYVIPTVDSARYRHIFNLHIKYNKNVLIIGPSGTGKTLLVEDILINNPDDSSRLALNLHITPKQVQTLILSKLNKRKQGFYTPPPKKKVLIFIEDLNTVKNDSVLELLRQQLDHNVWYDDTNHNPIYCKDLHYIVKANPPGGYQQEISPRLLRHFSIFSLNKLSDDTVVRLYSTILQNTWKKAGFPSDVTAIALQISQATLQVYNEVLSHFTPNINQTHYVFNLRDFSRVIQGCLFLRKEVHDGNKKMYVKLWVHEVWRVFGDRLNAIEDEKWLFDVVRHSFLEFFGEDEDVTQEGLRSLLFGFFHETDRYEEVGHLAVLEIVNRFLGEGHDVLMFEESVVRLCKLCRVLRSSPSNALLLGVSGSSRQSLTKLASFMNNVRFMQPRITPGYDLTDWDNQVKEVLREAGGCGNLVAFLVREQDLVCDDFLSNINYIFKGCEIPTLYNAEERQEILELVRLSAQDGNSNVDITSSAVFLFFHKRCLQNLHIFLSLSSLSKQLSLRLSKYPYLLNCNVIWWADWPDSYLENLATIRMQTLNIDENIKQSLPKICVQFHRHIQYQMCLNLKHNRKVFITTTHYAHMIQLFVETINKKQKSLSDKKHRYTLGLNKLSYAANQILNMQKSLAEYQPQLEEMTQKAMDMTHQIALETIEVEKASALVRTDEKVAHHQAEVAQVLKSECEAELAQAIPILEDAISALNTLKPSDITLVKSMKNPPDAIKLVMAAVCVIKDVRPDRIPDPSTGRKTLDYWGPSKRILGDMNFLQTLKEFDKDNIKAEIMLKIRKDYLPHKDFKPHVVAKASSAAEGLCKWIIAMDMYDKVAKEVAPKKEKLEKAEEEYAETMRVLNEKKEEVARIEGKLASLNELLSEARAKQQKLQVEVDICKEKLRKAQKLIGGLSGEKVRWTEISGELQDRFDCLSGDVVLSSGFVAYLGGFIKGERVGVLQKWMGLVVEGGVPVTPGFCLWKIMGQNFDSYGLLGDSVFQENVVILENSKFWPLLIDPHYLGFKGVYEKERQNNCVVVTLTEDYFKVIKDGVVFGKVVLLKDVGEEIPFELASLFNESKAHKNFRFYIFTNKHNPKYSAEIWNQMTILNFHITKVALTDRLLNMVVEIERPEFKRLKKDLDRKIRRNKQEVKQLEEKILHTLTESETDILEDEDSITILNESKDLAKVIRIKQIDSEKLKEPIVAFQGDYQRVAQHACSLYFCVNDLCNVHYMYRFSLDWFVDLYFQSILKAGISRDLDVRRRNLVQTFTLHLYRNVAESLYNKDKILLSFLISCRILLNEEKITEGDYLMFMCSKCEIDLQEVNPVPNHISDVGWNNVCHLESLKAFHGFKEDLGANISFWSDFLTNGDPFLVQLPGDWNTKLTSFHKLILVNILRPDKLYGAIPQFVTLELGEEFVTPLTFNINEVYNRSHSLQPIIFILTPGYNPLNDLKILVQQKNYTNKFRAISVGSKDSQLVSNLLETGKQKGSWIFLQNSHYLKTFLINLEKQITKMDYQNTHDNFRLWLSLEPYPEIQETLLQNSIKIINEPPQTLRLKLLKLYKEEPIIDETFYRGCPGKHSTFARLLYGLAFFHSSIQERQKMYSMETPYLFNDKDFVVSVQQLQSTINERNFTYNKLIYVIGNCNYGGYIESTNGKTLIKVLLSDSLNPNIVKKSSFLFNKVPNYGLPNKNDHQDYMNYIERLPSRDTPEIFGLHPNSDVRKGLQYKNEFLTSLFSAARLNQRDAIDENETLIFCMVSDLLNSLPEPLEIHKYNTNMKNDYKYLIINNEVSLYNGILRSVKQSLNNIKGVLEGFSTVNSKLNNIMNNLLRNHIPEEWLTTTPDIYDNNLTTFIDTLNKNVNYFATLINNYHLEEHKLSAYFNPKGLLCALKLNYSRKYNIALEDISMDYPVFRTENMEECIKISSLYLTNASWNINENRLEDTVSKKLYSFMPPIIFKPMLSNHTVEKRFKCQIFNRDVRKGCIFEKDVNYILSVLLNSDKSSEYWIKRGVALYCDVNL